MLLSLILYIIFPEIFSENIRQNNDIKGNRRNCNKRKGLKTSAFADHTTIYIGRNSSLAHLETQLIHFEKAADTKYNKTKCMGIWPGSNKATQGNL